LSDLWQSVLEYPSQFTWFLVTVAAVALPLWAAARFRRTYPHRPLVFLAMLPAALSVGLFVASQVPALASSALVSILLGSMLLADFVIGTVALADFFSLPDQSAFSAERSVGRIASLRKKHPVTLTVVNQSLNQYFVWIRDGVPHELRPQPDEFTLYLSGRSRATIEYDLHGTRRGAFVLRHVHVRIRSRLGLWTRYINYPLETTLHVYPDMKQLGEYAMLARTNRLSLLGVRRTRRVGQDNEFERLRDYTPDDNFKHIDWRSTARRRKLTVKDFQTNQSQRLIFMLDCGRMMTNEAAGISLLDHSLNAMLMLSYVALSHGDSVGLISFSDEIHGYLPPSSGLKQMNRLLHSSFDRFPNLVESRYDLAFLYLASHCRKRSLVVLISNVIDEVNANQIQRYLATMAGRHLTLGVLLRDRQLFRATDVPFPQGAALYQAAAAADILSWRQQVLADLESKGVLSLDVFPEDLTAPLVNRYLEIKARHLL